MAENVYNVLELIGTSTGVLISNDVPRTVRTSRHSPCMPERKERAISTTVAFYFCCDSACALRRLGGFGARVTMP